MQDLALHHFVMGLKPQISTIVRCRDPGDLNEAINFALSEEKILEASQRKHNFIPGPSNKNTYSRPNYRPNQPRDYHQFRPVTFNHNINRPSTNNTNPSSNSSYFCRYCKANGHTLENCQKREFNNKRFQINQNPRTFQPRLNNVPTNRINFTEHLTNTHDVIHDVNDEGIDTVDTLN